MFAPLLLLYRNKEQRHLNTQGRLHQQLKKDPVKGLKYIHFWKLTFLQCTDNHEFAVAYHKMLKLN